MKKKIENYFTQIVGLPLRDLGRASDLLWISLGKDIQLLNKRSKRTEISGEYSLNVQCSWRLVSNAEIILGSKDFYIPNSTIKDIGEEFDWDIKGNNRFDEQVNILSAKIKSKIFISSIIVDDLGGIKIIFTDNYYFEIFPDESLKEDNEFWRIFIPGNVNSHLVVTGNGIEEDD
jgi:hypothetical protein